MLAQVTQFLRYLEDEQGRSANTTAAYRNDLTQFTKFVTDRCEGIEPACRSWRAVDGDTVQGYLCFLKQNKYASATVARKVAAIKSFFHWLEENGLLGCNPAQGLEAPKVKRVAPRPIRPQEIERLLAEPARSQTAQALRDRALLETLYASGMRVTEVVGLNLDDIDLAQGVIHCGGRSSPEAGAAKKVEGRSKRRRVRLQPSALEALENYLANGRAQLLVRSEEEGLFLNHRGQRLTRQGLWLVIKRYAKQGGISAAITPHTLRQSFAAHQLNAGMGLQQVQEMLGHASPQTMQAYRKAADEMADELSGATRLDDEE